LTAQGVGGWQPQQQRIAAYSKGKLSALKELVAGAAAVEFDSL
jgi:hypothetical protein